MKTIALGQVIDEATELETVAMTIDAGSVSVLMRNLTNLYSNPAKAVFREYVSNALDSHIKAGVSTPIEVTLPEASDYEPTFIVRDFGVGLSKQEIIDIYSRYGSSTKRDSNEQIGAFGLGAKSALALTDRFDVVTVKDGVRVEFFVKKNGQGVGIVHFVDEAPTNEANGVEVRIPVPARKASDFAEVAKDFFFTWKPNTVILNGQLNSDTVYTNEAFTPLYSGGEAFAWISKSDTYRYSSGLEAIKFLVGGIVYEISSRNSLSGDANAKLGWTSEISKAFSELVKSQSPNIYINLPIGSVELTPSREELMFTDRTVNTIVAAVKDLLELTPLHFQDRLNSMDRADAVRFYGSFTSYFGQTIPKWNGELVPTNIDIDPVTYSVYSREGSSMADPKAETRINLISAMVQNTGMRNTRTILVTSNAVTYDNAVALRKNLRDYSASVYGDKNISTYLVPVVTNPWLQVVPSVTLDEVLSVAKAYRSAKKSEAQTGTNRTKASYVVWNGGDNLVKVTSDTIEGDVLYAVEDNSILNSIFYSSANDTYKGGRGNLNEHYKVALKSVFAGKTIIFLPANRSLANLTKQYPTAVNVNDFHADAVAEVIKANNVQAEVMATMARSRSTLEAFKMISVANAANINNIVIRSLVAELNDNGSRLVALNSYRQARLDTSKGFNLDEKLPLASVVGSRTLNEEQQNQLIALINLVIAK